jgi:hypothetical protein
MLEEKSVDGSGAGRREHFSQTIHSSDSTLSSRIVPQLALAHRQAARFPTRSSPSTIQAPTLRRGSGGPWEAVGCDFEAGGLESPEESLCASTGCSSQASGPFFLAILRHAVSRARVERAGVSPTSSGFGFCGSSFPLGLRTRQVQSAVSPLTTPMQGTSPQVPEPSRFASMCAVRETLRLPAFASCRRAACGRRRGR